MSFSKCMMTAALAGVVSAALACTDKAVGDVKRNTNAALDATKTGADKAIDATKKVGDATAVVAKDVARTTADKTTEIAGDVAQKSQEVASATGAAVTDGWITTKVKAKFSDETSLKGSHITVDTDDRVVTLRGTVLSAAAKKQAAAIARGTERVRRVVNFLVVE